MSTSISAPGATPVAAGATPVGPGATPVGPGATPVAPGATAVAPGAAPVVPGATPVVPGVLRRARLAALVLGTIAVAGCGGGIEGTYAGNDNTFLENITLKPGGKANVTFMGMTRQGTYEIDGREVTITVGTETQVLSFDDNGCLAGGGLLGTYCRSGDAPDEPREEKQQRLAGVYEAGDSNDGIRLHFERDGEVRVTLREGGATGDTAAGTYEVDGDRVRIAVTGGESLDLIRDGDTLEGRVGYATLKFEKR